MMSSSWLFLRHARGQRLALPMAFFGITSLGPPNVFELYRCGATVQWRRHLYGPAHRPRRTVHAIGPSCSQHSSLRALRTDPAAQARGPARRGAARRGSVVPWVCAL